MGDHKELLNPLTWCTREIRTRKVLAHVPPAQVHIDIGCGPEQYLLKKSPCPVKIGYDQQTGQHLTDTIPAQDNSADCVTMVASIEHLDSPEQIIKECRRVLKETGVLIITTPKAAAGRLFKLYDPHYESTEGPHRRYYTYDSMRQLLEGSFRITIYRTFLCGLNQLFVCAPINSLHRTGCTSGHTGARAQGRS